MLLISIIGISLIGAGCTTTQTPQVQHVNEIPSHDSHTMNEGRDLPLNDQAIDADNRLITDKQSSNLKVGNNEFRFKLYDTNHQELTPENLKTVHDKKVHFLIAKNDLSHFEHVHPEYKNGVWSVAMNIPKNGTYYTYTDISPISEKPVVLFNTLLVGRASTATLQFPTTSSNLNTKNGAIEVQLSSPHIIAGMPTELTFTLTENKAPVTDIGTYLGAYGHVVALQHGSPKTFLHLHPLTTQKPSDGKILFNTTFNEDGRYTLFAQFNIRNTVQTFPITLDVVDNMMKHN